MNIFTNKKLTYGLMTLAVVMVLLVLILLTYLAQLASINAELARLEELIALAETDAEALEELQEYISSNEYICQWAEDNNLTLPGDLVWQPE